MPASVDESKQCFTNNVSKIFHLNDIVTVGNCYFYVEQKLFVASSTSKII